MARGAAMGPPRTLVIATRGSRLALAQTEVVTERIKALHPRIEVEVLTVSTKGDVDKSRPFAALGGKGLFTTEVERAVVEGRADVAVHSAKDLTADLASGCRIVGVTSRASVADVVVGGEGASGEERIASLPSGALIGTSSMRRRALLAEARPDLEAVELRGNLDTRLRKVADGEVTVAVVAAAGMERLGAAAAGAGPDAAPLDPQWWVPAPGQGALAVEALEDRPDLHELFEASSDRVTWAELVCERAFAARLEGGCSVPLGCHARVAGDSLVATGYLGAPDGSHGLRDRISGGPAHAEALGEELAAAIHAGGGAEDLSELRRLDESEVPQITGP